MLRVHIVCVGKLKEKYLRDASLEYEKRLKSFCKLNIKELAESRLPDNPSNAEVDKALTREGADILSSIPKQSVAIALCIEGNELSSEGLSQKIDEISGSGVSDVCFIIGSSHGICDEVKKACKLKLSMSAMTFPHMLARIMLLEQIYRAFSISGGRKYHK